MRVAGNGDLDTCCSIKFDIHISDFKKAVPIFSDGFLLAMSGIEWFDRSYNANPGFMEINS